MTQLTYPVEMAIAFPGLLATGSKHRETLSRKSEEATSFGYGNAVVRGTDPDTQALLPTGAADVLGVAQHSHANAIGSDGLNLVDDEKLFNVLHIGSIYVEVEEAVTPASPVFVRVAAGAGGTQLGAFRASADTATALAASGMRFLTSAASGGFAVLEIDADAAIA